MALKFSAPSPVRSSPVFGTAKPRQAVKSSSLPDHHVDVPGHGAVYVLGAPLHAVALHRLGR
jgi:hypothetical protein